MVFGIGFPFSRVRVRVKNLAVPPYRGFAVSCPSVPGDFARSRSIRTSVAGDVGIVGADGVPIHPMLPKNALPTAVIHGCNRPPESALPEHALLSVAVRIPRNAPVPKSFQ